MWSKMLCLSFWHLQYGSVRDDSWLSSISPYSGLLFEEHWFTWYFNDQRLASWTSDTVKRLTRLVKTLGPRGPRGALFVQHGRLFASYPSYPSYPTPILISTSSPHLTWIPIPRIGPFWNHFHQNLVFKENLKKKKQSYPPPSHEFWTKSVVSDDRPPSFLSCENIHILQFKRLAKHQTQLRNAENSIYIKKPL